MLPNNQIGSSLGTNKSNFINSNLFECFLLIMQVKISFKWCIRNSLSSIFGHNLQNFSSEPYNIGFCGCKMIICNHKTSQLHGCISDNAFTHSILMNIIIIFCSENFLNRLIEAIISLRSSITVNCSQLWGRLFFTHCIHSLLISMSKKTSLLFRRNVLNPASVIAVTSPLIVNKSIFWTMRSLCISKGTFSYEKNSIFICVWSSLL